MDPSKEKHSTTLLIMEWNKIKTLVEEPIGYD